MKNHFKQSLHLLQYSWKTILYFEIIYRILGVAVIFPLGNQLLYLSVRLTGSHYISNLNFIDYLLRPTTILIFVIFALFLAVYVLFEITTLSIIFHLSKQNKHIKIIPLIRTSFSRLLTVLKQKHIVILLSTLIFFLLIEGFHIVGIASTIKLPRIIVNEFDTIPILRYVVIGLVFILLILFVQTLFFELISILQGKKMRESFKEQEKILKGNRLKIFIEFFALNAIVNLLLYGLYVLVLGSVSLIIRFFVDSSAIFGILLSIMYIIFLAIGFIATIILMPINYAWINSWYYSYHPVKDTSLLHSSSQKSMKMSPIFKRIALVVLIVLVGVNAILIRDQIISPSTPIQLLNNPRIIAHRGSSFDAPENTIAAIEQAITDGADAVEIDIRITKDGVPVLMHDETLGRTTNDSLNRRVANTTYDDIQLLDAGSWFGSDFIGEKVPTLEEALLTARGRVKVYVEFKGVPIEFVPMIVELIEDVNMSYFVKILSFDEETLSMIKDENNNIQTVLLIIAFLGDIKRLSSLEFVDAIGVRTQLVENNRSYITTLQQEGKEVYVFTANDSELIRDLNSLGVNGIITDVPILTREIVYEDTTNDRFERLIRELFVPNQ